MTPEFLNNCKPLAENYWDVEEMGFGMGQQSEEFSFGRIKFDMPIRHHFMANRWGNSGNSDRVYFGGL